MKKNIKLLSTILVGASILTVSGAAMAAETTTGSAGAAQDTDYTIEEMLGYAIQDEYMAQAEYDAIMDAYGVQKPFSNIIRSEATHINLLIPLFETYGFEVPVNDAAQYTVIPTDITESYAIGVKAEIKNIDMYEKFLAEDLPSDIEEVFEALQSASEKHLAAFERSVDRGTGTGNVNKSGNGISSGSGNGNNGGKGGVNQFGNNGTGRGNGGGMGTGNLDDCLLD